jgi:hypothetical protein
MEKELKVLRLMKKDGKYIFSYSELDPKRGMATGMDFVNSKQGRIISSEPIDTEIHRDLLKNGLIEYNNKQLAKYEQEFLKKKEEIMSNIKEIEGLGEKLI